MPSRRIEATDLIGTRRTGLMTGTIKTKTRVLGDLSIGIIERITRKNLALKIRVEVRVRVGVGVKVRVEVGTKTRVEVGTRTRAEVDSKTKVEEGSKTRRK